MFYIGIDIGSTASKVCVFENDNIKDVFVLPTGWSSVKTAEEIKNKLKEIGADKKNSKIVATGYGRVSVPYADKTITEITCHGKGAYYLFKKDCTVIDIGGQDVKTQCICHRRNVRKGKKWRKCNYKLYVYSICRIRSYKFDR